MNDGRALPSGADETVSQHTAVLRSSGLISTRREGATVIHLATTLGLMLLDPDPDAGTDHTAG